MSSKKVCMSICNDDRISSLPDCVLSHILSFLPTKYSVRTSVLSVRWNHLFTLVPVLDFEYNIFTINNQNSSASSSLSFVHFVNSVFVSYNVSCMNKFHFSFFSNGQTPDHFPIVSWISSVVRRQVREINISTCLNSKYTLPRNLFSCKTLVTLSLQGRFSVALPHTVCLPCLRDCQLLCVEFDDESARRLFRSCLVLENLDLSACKVGEGVKLLDISSPTLKNLVIWGGANYQIMLDLPNLICFNYVGPIANEFFGLDSLKSMVDASVYFEPDMYTIDGAVLELVRSYCHVQQLCLNCDVIEAFIHSGHSLPKFNNLTSLTLPIAPISSAASRLLPSLLDNSPRLEFLEIYKGCGEDHNGDGENSYLLPEHVPACVSLNLKEVEFFFTGLDYERELIKYFLKYANNLKTMTIRSKISWSEQFEISSEGCQIIYDSDDVE